LFATAPSIEAARVRYLPFFALLVACAPETLRQTEHRVGVAVDAERLVDDATYARVVAAEFNALTPENAMKWGPIHPDPERWDFAPADAIVGFAEAHAMRVKGHALVWHLQLPDWALALTGDALKQAMIDHIHTLVSRYRGRVAAWDVVNEALLDDGSWRPTPFHEALGEEYVALAFAAAHDADPDAELLYNDYGAEGSGAKADAVLQLVAGLQARGVPIHGVGLQMHVGYYGRPQAEAVRANVARLSALGLHVNISEMDVTIRFLGGRDESAQLARQGQVYEDLIAAAVRGGAAAVTVWGLRDDQSWLDALFGAGNHALLFDERYQKKPAYRGVRAALQR
jgi:endo-1,4-beta-xylanase